MLSLKRLTMISRPATYLPLVLTYGLGVVLSGSTVSWRSLLGALFFTLPISLIVYGLNDIADRESDAKNARKGGVDGVVLRASEAKTLLKIIIFTMILGALLFFVTGQYGLLFAIIAVYGIGYAYSVQPFRLKAVPMLDSLSNGVCVSCIFLAGYWAESRGLQLITPSTELLTSIALCAAAFHGLWTVVDYEVDKASRTNTLAVYFGKTRALLFCSLLYLGSFALIGNNHFLTGLYLLTCAMLACIACRYSSPKQVRRITILTLILLPVALLPAII